MRGEGGPLPFHIFWDTLGMLSEPLFPALAENVHRQGQPQTTYDIDPHNFPRSSPIKECCVDSRFAFWEATNSTDASAMIASLLSKIEFG